MQIIFYIIKKEFRQIFRNRIMIPIIFVMPVVQMLILVYAATFEMKNLNFVVVDNDHSQTSQQLIQKISASPFFNYFGEQKSVSEAKKEMNYGNTDIILVFPHQFEENLIKEQKNKIQVLIDGINGTKAGMGSAYLSQIFAAYNKEIMAKYLKFEPQESGTIQISENFWYNPLLNYKVYMVPGIIAVLVTVIGMMLSGLNLVREKEIGTIDQINVTPIKKYHFLLGKLVPFLIIALFDLSFGLVIAKLAFNIPFVGSLLTLFAMASAYLIAALGVGLFISTVANNQQQVMFIAYFILMVFMLMSGLFTPAESMPHWAQTMNLVNPIYYFMKSIRMILLKGSTLADLKTEFYSLIVYGISIMSLAIVMYRKRS